MIGRLRRGLGTEQAARAAWEAATAARSAADAAWQAAERADGHSAAPAPGPPAPGLSVLVVTASQDAHLARCLASVRDTVPVLHEIVVLLNAASPAVGAVAQAAAAADPRVRPVPVPVPLGFAGGLNHARAHARGAELLVLHDDAELTPGALAELQAAARAHPSAGIVAPRVLYPDGRLQATGAVQWADGTTVQLDETHAYHLGTDLGVRRVDYSSSACLYVRGEVWDAVGGPDEALFPTKFVDVDLCLGCRAVGRDVIVAPRAVVRHERHATVLATAELRYFAGERNLVRIRERWGEVLAADHAAAPSGPPGPADVARAIERAQARPLRPGRPPRRREPQGADRIAVARELDAELRRAFAAWLDAPESERVLFQ